MPRLSVCLIVKNEALHLERCLGSVRGLADEIVVVDTGSTDETLDIARAHGARVFHFEWQDDFAAARNFSIERATGAWILCLDGDEAIAARDHDTIRMDMGREDIDAVVFAQRHYLPAEIIAPGWRAGSGGYEEGAGCAGYLDVDCRRMFRNDPRLRFRNRVHEELVSIDRSRPLREVRGEWVIHHFGKLGGAALLRAKSEAYIRIGLMKVEEQPDDPQAHYELGIQYSELNEPAAAIRHYQRTLELAPGFRDVWLRMAHSQLKLAHYREALDALKTAAAAHPDRAVEVAVAQGRAHYELGDNTNAERAFKRALKMCAGFPLASLGLARLYRSQRRLGDALACLDASRRSFPAHAPIRRLRAELRLERGDEEGAIADLQAIGDEPAARQLARVLIRQRRFADARACLIESASGQDAEIAALHGAIALGLGELDTAAELLRRSLQVEATHEAAVNLSVVCEARSDLPGALDAAAEALRLEPGSEDALGRFGRLSAGLLGRPRRPGKPDRLTVFFYMPHRQFDGTTPRTAGLGGTESAVVYLAEALTRRGHRCVVLNGSSPATVEGVEYARWETLPVRSVADRPDVVVGVRFWKTLGRARFAPLQILWTGDAYDQPFLDGLSAAENRREIDFFALESAWQAETFRDHHAIPAARILQMPYGTASSAMGFAAPDLTRHRPRRLAYASTPFRGLDVLLDLFPRVRAACPDAELEVFSSMRVYGVSAAEDDAQYAELYDKAKQPGVTLVGSVGQQELARRLQQTRVLAYPNHYAETFCIAAAEAQAAGCVVVTSDLGALPETVGSGGLCITGDPRGAAYGDAFLTACADLLRNDDRWLAMARSAVAHAESSFSWPAIAARWEAVCMSALRDETPELERLAVHLAAGRDAFAQRMLERLTKPADIPHGAWAALQSLAQWRAGSPSMPAPDVMQAVLLHFPAMRRSGVAERPTARHGAARAS